MSSFHERIKALRDAKGWSLSKAAIETGLARSYLYQLEAGDSEPTISKLLLLAKAYGVSLDYLAYGSADNDAISDVIRTYEQLPEEDQREMLLFADYLKWRKRYKQPRRTRKPAQASPELLRALEVLLPEDKQPNAGGGA